MIRPLQPSRLKLVSSKKGRWDILDGTATIQRVDSSCRDGVEHLEARGVIPNRSLRHLIRLALKAMVKREDLPWGVFPS
jgi:hypothetical protein